MNKAIKILKFACFATWMIIFTGCKKNAEIPSLTTHVVSDITPSSAVTGGSVTSNGGADVTVRGVCWGITHNPTVDFTKTTDGAGSGFFSSNIAGLEPNTIYYVRAYATNSVGTAYGNEISFTSQDLPPGPPDPDVITSAITSITSFSAVSGGSLLNIQSDFLPESGICWSTSQNPTREDSKSINETGELNFISNLTGLTQGTTYYVRAYAIYGTTFDNDILYGNEISFTTSFAQGEDPRKADFPGGVRYNAAIFSIGTKVFLGLGYNLSSNFFRDFWEWDEATDVWTRKADYPGNASGGVVSFSIGTKGYIGTGNIFGTTGSTNEFWEYDPAANSWTQKESLPNTPSRAYAAGFSIGNKGYIGVGIKDGGVSGYYQDFWEWDQTTNKWTKKADFPGNARTAAIGFSIGSKGYIGTGGDGTSLFKDFWEWDQATNVWTKKSEFGGTSRWFAVGFSIGNKGYIGTGNNENLLKDFWEWDPATNVWTGKSDFKGDARTYAVGVSIGNKAYIGTGVGDIDFHPLKDFWEYDPNLK